MKLKNISVLQLGKISAFIYIFFALIISPFMLIPALISGSKTFFPMLFMLLAYPIMGFVAGILAASVNNFSARIIGGIVLEFDENS